MSRSAYHQLSPIELCPNEILSQVKDHLVGDLPQGKALQPMLNLRLACRRLNSFFTQFIMDRLVIEFIVCTNTRDPGPGHGELFHFLMRDILSNKTTHTPIIPVPDAFIPCLSTLVLDIFPGYSIPLKESTDQLSPFWDELSRYTSLKSLVAMWDGAWIEVDRDGSLYECLARQLLQTVNQATNGRLSSIEWCCSYSLHLVSPISQFLSVFQHLQNLSLELYDASDEREAQLPWLLGDPLVPLPSLRSLSLSWDSQQPLYSPEELLQMVFPKTSIEVLHIAGVVSTKPLKPHPALTPSTTPTLPSFPPIRNLKDISLNSYNQYATEDMPNVDLLWAHLQRSGVRLTNLSLEYGISRSLLKYLSSYQGLEECEFDVSIFPINLASISFVDAVLVPHASSLTSLSITFLDRQLKSGWEAMAIDPEAWPKPSTFLHLAHLTVITPRAWQLDAKECQVVVNYATEIPKLRTLEVGWSNVDYVIDATIGDEVLIRRCGLHSFRISACSFLCSVVWGLTFPPMSCVVAEPCSTFPLNTISEHHNEP